MALADSMFLFEIFVEELTSFINCREFCIKSQFADVFSIILRDPNEQVSFLHKRARKMKMKKKLKHGRAGTDKTSVTAKLQAGQSILFENHVDTLISNMEQYPMELSLWSKLVPDYKIGSTRIPWGSPFYDYLNKLHRRQELPPVCVKGDYNVFDEFTSKRMAVIKLNVKLSYLKDATQFESLSEDNQLSMYTSFNSKVSPIMSPIKDKPISYTEGTGTIKTIYKDEKRKVKKFIHHKNKKSKKEVKKIEVLSNELMTKSEYDKLDSGIDTKRLLSGIISLVRSDTNVDSSKQVAIIKSKSCSSINEGHFNVLNHIFGSNMGPFGNQVYCVGYFTVQNEFADSPRTVQSAKSTSGESEKSKSSKSDEKVKERYKFRLCDSNCPAKKTGTGSRTQSVCSLDLPKEASHLITLKKCDRVDCDHRLMRELPPPPDDRILIDLSSRKKDCCDVSEKVEEVVGGMKATMKFGDDPCYCECECRFGFTKKTTFCNICGGYEIAGEEYAKLPGYDLPFPCPIFHKLADKSKMKTLSTSGSDSKRKEFETKVFTSGSDSKRKEGETKVFTSGSDSKRKEGETKVYTSGSDSKRKEGETKAFTKQKGEKSIESEKETTKKGKKKKKDDRFKLNFGYTGIPPHIGHSQCAMPCTGTLGVVPKGMGWLWNAENIIPGMKHRPSWKPGAVGKRVVRLLKIAKNPGEVLAKKRKKETAGKAKRPLKRPLLTVQKKDGEYTVTMETMKTYTKPRTFNQYPYEDKPLVTYTIGRTSEENLERKKKKERARRRLERDQRDFIQGAFRDMCNEICLKTYQQALGILPDAERPDCPCYPAEPGPEQTDLDHSCSCSEDKDLSESDTDSDEWIVEFTPPNATFDPSFKSKKIVLVDDSSQYTYLDYKVKLLDRYGNPVPRYFKGPDGKQECSDLGGFWGPNNKWLEINTDGFIGPDGKWAPNTFQGPNGEQVDAETGKFQATDGKWLVVGVDGYVDSQGKWKFYPKPKPQDEKKTRLVKKGVREKKEDTTGIKPSEATWSCFGSVSPKTLSKMGIIGHGHDKKLLLSALQNMLAQGEDVKIPVPSSVPRTGKAKHGTSVPRTFGALSRSFVDKRKCRHATPSDKGIIAVDGHGNKTYFRMKDFCNKRPKERIANLTNRGISLSSFHMPCFHSFISSEVMKKQQYDRLVALAKGADPKQKHNAKSTQADYVTDHVYKYIV